MLDSFICTIQIEISQVFSARNKYFKINCQQTSANWGPGSKFVLEANIKVLVSKSNRSGVIKLMV